ncbi:hypothetical protein EAD89_18385 [Micromonospora sp. BL4]|uniref:AAA family ATPase n=1 Tax=Micromonospora sp. BL4 TaxID=2478710 RepID=UPI000EF5B425|nr:AAA family ATPase [Micromonospora sp. BL4]RLP87667.1 hypothetical protein EAD89_18385 [Micromonospora sp. BL4]
MPYTSRPTKTPSGRARLGKVAPLGKLIRYEVVGLFGSRNREFTLDQDEPTLLTGANGSGKSTILRTIDFISTGRWQDLFAIPFHSITLDFDSGMQFAAHRSEDSAEIYLTGEEPWVINQDELWQHKSWWNLSANSALVNVRNSIAHGSSLTDELFQSAIAERLGHLPAAERLALLLTTSSRAPEWIKDFSTRFPVLFITDQRLVIEPAKRKSQQGSSSTEAVTTRFAAEEAAQNIAEEIAAAQAAYASRSQSLDRNFPQRVIRAIATTRKASENELRRQLDTLTKQRRLLREVALLPQEAEDEFDELDFTAPHTRAVIATYIQDTKKKLAVLEPLRRRLALFSQFVNRHFEPKSIWFDIEKGFTIAAGEGNESLPPKRLSSGEQQLLVLAHHVLFRAAPGTLVLIDEPELSLHVVWQATLVDDLTEMGRERDLTFVLATHSPTLIAGRNDLRRSLDTRH